jgi:hypothetical protein
METKTIVAAAAGLALGAGFGATLWWSTRVRRGHVYRVKDLFYADQALVDDLARRLPGAQRPVRRHRWSRSSYTGAARWRFAGSMA